MSRSQEELQKAFAEQVLALLSSCAAYDAGHEWEARRLATTIVNLVHDKGRTQSLLGQLGQKQQIKWFTTSSPNHPGNVLPWSPMVMIVGGLSGYKPIMDAPLGRSEFIAFEDWWNETVYEDGPLKLSRSVLLRTLRDQDGGSHYDPEISDGAYKLMKGGAGWFMVAGDGTELPMSSAELATARQIAYEVITTFSNAALVASQPLPNLP